MLLLFVDVCRRPRRYCGFCCVVVCCFCSLLCVVAVVCCLYIYILLLVGKGGKKENNEEVQSCVPSGDYFCTGARIRKTDVRPALGKSARGLRLE